jgi:hypothetical protein
MCLTSQLFVTINSEDAANACSNKGCALTIRASFRVKPALYQGAAPEHFSFCHKLPCPIPRFSAEWVGYRQHSGPHDFRKALASLLSV